MDQATLAPPSELADRKHLLPGRNVVSRRQVPVQGHPEPLEAELVRSRQSKTTAHGGGIRGRIARQAERRVTQGIDGCHGEGRRAPKGTDPQHNGGRAPPGEPRGKPTLRGSKRAIPSRGRTL